MKILAIALSGIGDAIMFTPSVKKLKELLPGAQIDVMAMFGGVRDIYTRMPEVENVRFHRFLSTPKIESLRFLMSLRGQYDAAVSVYPSNRSVYNFINFFTGAPQRYGHTYLRRNNENLSLLLNNKLTENDKLHNVEENIRLVELITGKKAGNIPGMEFPLTEDDEAFADEYEDKLKFKEHDFVIGMHPGCSTLKNHIHRRWSPENFALLAKKIAVENNAKVLFFGGPDEKELRMEILKFANNKNVISVEAGNLAESAALMKRCNVFVSNDSGLMHAAAALRMKVVGIFGPTDSIYVHPWGTDYRIAKLNLECQPCYRYSPTPLKCFRDDVKFKCIKELTVDDVYSKTMELLQASSEITNSPA